MFFRNLTHSFLYKFDRVLPYELLVRAGTTFAGQGGTLHFVRSVEISPSYRDVPDSSDVGLVHLLVSIPLTSKTKPIAMSAVTPSTGELAWVTGFGSQDIQKIELGVSMSVPMRPRYGEIYLE